MNFHLVSRLPEDIVQPGPRCLKPRAWCWPSYWRDRNALTTALINSGNSLLITACPRFGYASLKLADGATVFGIFPCYKRADAPWRKFQRC